MNFAGYSTEELWDYHDLLMDLDLPIPTDLTAHMEARGLNVKG